MRRLEHRDPGSIYSYTHGNLCAFVQRTRAVSNIMSLTSSKLGAARREGRQKEVSGRQKANRECMVAKAE